jgi:hypothetical protein
MLSAGKESGEDSGLTYSRWAPPMTSMEDAKAITWTNLFSSPQRRLALILWLVAAHSLCVGLGLIFLPDDLLSFFGFAPGGERFFRVQAGVFHFVMVVVYATAAVHFITSPDSTYLAIAAKFIAMVFLIFYYLLGAQILMVLISGLVDGAFGVIIAWAFSSYRQTISATATRSPG